MDLALRWSCWCLLAALVGVHAASDTKKKVRVNVDKEQLVYEVKDYFLSVCIDQFIFVPDRFPWFKQDFDAPMINNLLEALGPGILRVGGTYSSYMAFDMPKDKLDATEVVPHMFEATKEQLKNMTDLANRNGMSLLWDLNAQLLHGNTWDPTNFIDMLDWAVDQGYSSANLEFELGNEPAAYAKHDGKELSPERIGESFVIARKIMESYPEFAKGRLVGPDVVTVRFSNGQAVIKGYVNVAADYVDAMTFHQYYIPQAERMEQFLDLDEFNELEPIIKTVQDTVKTTIRPDIPIWLGESGNTFNSRINASAAYVSGFLWMDKLGISAKMGLDAVIRQTLYGYRAGYLNLEFQIAPDYWMSVLHKRLVGTKVLDLQVQKGVRRLRAYAHCTNTRRSGYKAGSITVFGMNLEKSISQTIIFDHELRTETVHVYLLEPDDPGAGLLAKYVALNGKRLELNADSTLPRFRPASQDAVDGVTLPPLTFGYFVFPFANFRVCK